MDNSIESGSLEESSSQRFQKLVARGFTVLDDTVYSSEALDANKPCPCCNEPLAGKILERIKMGDTGEEVLLHRYHSGTSVDKQPLDS